MATLAGLIGRGGGWAGTHKHDLLQAWHILMVLLSPPGKYSFIIKMLF